MDDQAVEEEFGKLLFSDLTRHSPLHVDVDAPLREGWAKAILYTLVQTGAFL